MEKNIYIRRLLSSGAIIEKNRKSKISFDNILHIHNIFLYITYS